MAIGRFAIRLIEKTVTFSINSYIFSGLQKKL